MNKHDHIFGRPRNHISRKWFYRGKHRTGVSVEEIGRKPQVEKDGFSTSIDGKYMIYRGRIRFPKDLGS